MNNICREINCPSYCLEKQLGCQRFDNIRSCPVYAKASNFASLIDPNLSPGALISDEDLTRRDLDLLHREMVSIHAGQEIVWENPISENWTAEQNKMIDEIASLIVNSVGGSPQLKIEGDHCFALEETARLLHCDGVSEFQKIHRSIYVSRAIYQEILARAEAKTSKKHD